MADVSVQEARERARADALDAQAAHSSFRSWASTPHMHLGFAQRQQEALNLLTDYDRAIEALRGTADELARAVAEAATLRQALERAQVFETEAELAAEITRLREAIASAMTSLATGPAKDGYAYSVLEEALAGTPARETTPDG